MKQNIAVLLMALALASPAVISTAQDADQPRPLRGQRPPPRDGDRPGGPGAQGERPLPPRDGQPGDPPGDRPRPPVPPLVAVLDANHDGVIDETEIANASAALRKLDKNGDGKLTMDELRPRPQDGRGPGGPDGPGVGEGRPRPPRGQGFDRGPQGPDSPPPPPPDGQPRPQRQRPSGD